MLQGFPADYEIRSVKQLNHICQTVPVHTAADMTEAAVQFCRGELSASGDQFLKQDNISQTNCHDSSRHSQPTHTAEEKKVLKDTFNVILNCLLPLRVWAAQLHGCFVLCS